MKNFDITHIFYCPEVIRALIRPKRDGSTVIAVGDQGAVYVSGAINSVIDKIYQPDNGMYIFPNPTMGPLTISRIVPGKEITIYNNLGKQVMSFIPQEKEENINLRLVPGTYCLKQGADVKIVIVFN